MSSHPKRRFILPVRRPDGIAGSVAAARLKTVWIFYNHAVVISAVLFKYLIYKDKVLLVQILRVVADQQFGTRR